MQTFLPSPSFVESASILDNKRLGKQRVETLQIMSRLALPRPGGWGNHPAIKMWQGYEWALMEYQIAICTEWHVYRGFQDTCLRKTMDLFYNHSGLDNEDILPFWLGDEEFHYRHQSNLLRKNPEHYRPMFSKDIPDNLEYIWPIE